MCANQQSFVTLPDPSSLSDGAIYIVPTVLGDPAGLSFCVAWNHDREEAKSVADKEETWQFAAVNRDPKRQQTDVMKELSLTPSTVGTVVRKRRAVEANALILYSKTKEAREAMRSQARNCFRDSSNNIAILVMLRRYSC